MNNPFKALRSGVMHVKAMFGDGHEDGTADDNDIFLGKDGETLFKSDIINDVLTKLEDIRSQKAFLENQWKLNANFLCGNQFCEINVARGDVEQLEAVYDWLEREPFNRIAPLYETRRANLNKINYRMKVKPHTNELDDYSKASVSTSILQNLQEQSNFTAKNHAAIAWNELCGSCFFLSWWDNSKGELYARTPDSDYYTGDIDYGLLSPYEVFPQDIYKEGIASQRWIIVEQVKSVDEVYDLYGVKLDGGDVDTYQLTPVSSGGGYGYENTVMALGTKVSKDSVRLVTYFERPSRDFPNGRMIIVAGESELIYYGELPYDDIPIVQMICRDTPGQFFGKSFIEDLIPFQRAYNNCINRIHEFIKRVAIQSYMVEEGSIDVEEYETNGLAPGIMLVYSQGSNPPVPIRNGNLPSEILNEREQLKNDMEYIAGTSQLMVNGSVPSGVTSGTAIENLINIDNTRLSLTGDRIRDAVKELSKQWLHIYKRYGTAKRVIQCVGTNDIGNALVWCNEDINSFDIDFTTENELIMSEEAQKQRFIEAVQMGLFTDSNGQLPQRVKSKMIELMKINGYSEIMNLSQLQINAAQRENTLFERGVIPKVSEFDEHEIHLEEHLRYLYQMDYQLLKRRKPEYAELFEQHIRNHKQAIAENGQQALMQAMAGGMKR